MVDSAFPLPGVTTVATIGDWESLFYPGFQSGVVPGVGNELAPSLDATGRNAVINTGGALVRAFYKPVSASTATAIPAASSQNRIDRLVLRLDRSQTVAANFIVPVVITGTPGSSPQPPALTQTPGGLWDLPIAYWTSTSTGGLTGLVDERDFAGGSLSAGFSAGHHTPGRPGLRIDKDTGQLLMSVRGTSWDTTVFKPPDPWAPFNPLSHLWAVASDGRAQARVTRDNEVQLSAYHLQPGTVTDGTVVATLAPKYRPMGYHQFAVAADILAVASAPNNKGASFVFGPNGNLTCWDISTNATVVGFEVKIPLDL